MFALRRVAALVLGQDNSPQGLHAELEASAVPVTNAQCRSCPDPCDEGQISSSRRHEGYPKFDVDMESHMLGSVKTLVISTGKIDWDREVTDTKGSLAAFLAQVEHRKQHASHPRRPSKNTSGVFNATDSKRVSILNGSHNTLCHDPDYETILVFPDYKLVTEVPRSVEGAQNLWDTCVDPELGRAGGVLEKSPFNSWVIPYACVILLCSHKKRDKRCSIAAAKLEHAFTQTLESKGWTVDTQLEHPMDDPLEEFVGSPEEQEENIIRHLQELQGVKKALIIRNSHIGGHRYAGNCIIYTPQGAGVWYGRVSTHEVDSIVTNTIEDGLVLPKLLRGGVNISRPGCSRLHDW
ncbi:Sucrase/ferredoxin-like-domain-containing protein [Armillaria novae-zelandiae]|uniref:Sucrase/ferredoxin-like-domain-containing protein n=1 Tax=Armillaria novae-zelandiae TaxID=153914 RepID=A0AA39PUE5_9AGAR|nr:Sucrase/ferredoxin-like-domain-containing protein [Armillaria novae-zelandiae]